MNWINFNDDNTNKGIEGKYCLEDEKLIFYIKPTNSREDWITDFVAFRKWDDLAECKVHAGFKKYARWMEHFVTAQKNIHIPHEVYVFGYSMGGGIAQILGEYDYSYNIISIDGARTTTKLTNSKSILYFNKGSLVSSIPFWFKHIENRICLNNKWLPLWKSHADYDIDKIIKENIK